MEGADVPGVRDDRLVAGDGADAMSHVDPIDTGIVDWVFDGRLTARGYTATDLATTARLLLRPCPYCGAPPGEWCRNTGTGQLLDHLDSQHVARRLRRDAVPDDGPDADPDDRPGVRPDLRRDTGHQA
jgi:hypothetical protein